MSIMMFILGFVLACAGGIQDPAFNGLDLIGWALLFAGTFRILTTRSVR